MLVSIADASVAATVAVIINTAAHKRSLFLYFKQCIT